MSEFIDTNDSLVKAQQVKILKEVHNGVYVLKELLETYIIVVATNKDSNKNYINSISCKKGIPIEGYVYDAQSDCYFIECSDFLHLGVIPFSFVIKSKSSQYWKTNIPIPESVIKKNLTDSQKKDLRNFKNHFKSDDYIINYVQMVSPN
jgi:hypothetical protein